MGENGCQIHEDMGRRLACVEDYVEKIDERVVTLELNTALDSQKFGMILENLSRLPDAIDGIKESLVTMQEEIKNSNDKTDGLKEQVEMLNDKVSKIDEEGTFNIRQFIKDHFIATIVLVAGASIYASTVILPFIQSLIK